MFSEVLSLYRQAIPAWSEGTWADEAALLDLGASLSGGDGAEALVNLLFGLRSSLQGASVLVPLGAWADGDPTEANRVDLDGRRLVLVHKPTGTAVTCRAISSPDDFNRLGDFDESIGPGEIVAIGPFGPQGWAQADGYLYLLPGAAGLRLTVTKTGG